MELTYKELKKRDVVNVADGRSLGHIVNLKLIFPKGLLAGIFVSGRRMRGLLSLFDRSEMFIPERNILKIGGDVILVNLKCEDACGQSVNLNTKDGSKQHNLPCSMQNQCNTFNDCPPINCPPHKTSKQEDNNFFDMGDY